MTLQGLPAHEHAPDPIGNKFRGEVNRLRQKGLIQKTARPSSVIAEIVPTISSDSVKGRMPSVKLLRQQINYGKKKAGPALPRNPKKREHLVIPDSLKVYWH